MMILNDIHRIITMLIICVFFGKEGEIMMAMLWAQKIMNMETVEEAKAMCQRVPRLLKAQVHQILVESGMEELIAE